MMFLGNLNYVAIAVVGGLRVALGRDVARRRAGVHPVLPPVHPAADPAGLDGQRAAVRHRLGRAGLRAARRPRAGRRRGEPAPRRAAGRAGRVRPRAVLVRPRQPADRGPVAGRRAGRHRRHRRADRRRQDHAGQPHHALLRARRRHHPPRRPRHLQDAPPRPALGHRHGAPGHLAVRRHDPREHRLRQPRRHRGADPRGGPRHLRRPVRPLAARRATTPSSTTRAAPSAPARSSCSPSPAPSWPTRPS